MPEENNLNQNSNLQADTSQNANPLSPETMSDVKLHAEQIAKTESGWREEKHQEIDELRKFASSPEIRSPEGITELELRMRNLGMPGVNYSGYALDQLDKREEAMMEERALRQQGKSYLKLAEPEKRQAEARIYNGYNFRSDWRRIYDYAEINRLKFEVAPTTPEGKALKRGVEIIIGNELRLAAARNHNLGLNYEDNQKIAELSSNIAGDSEFIQFLNNEKKYFPNVTNIKLEIIKRIPTNETTRNL